MGKFLVVWFTDHTETMIFNSFDDADAFRNNLRETFGLSSELYVSWQAVDDATGWIMAQGFALVDKGFALVDKW